MQKLVIHAGIHRTGTTALQTLLFANRQELAHRGFSYPFQKKNHQELAWQLHRGDLTGEAFADMLAASQKSAEDIILLSAEDLSIHKRLNWLAAVKARFDVTAYFYLRRQDHWLNSWYNQHLKWPFDRTKSVMTPQQFLGCLADFYWINYEMTLGKWADALGRERLVVSAVEPGQVTDVLADFCRQNGIPLAELRRDETVPNDSLPVQSLGILRHMNRHVLTTRERNVLNTALRSALGDAVTEVKTPYSPEERNEMIDHFAASNRAVAQRYFGRDELFLAPRPANGEIPFDFEKISQDELLEKWVAPLLRWLLKNPGRQV
ncbi:hypothetical protein BH10PSE7_BH10PSE7_23180 [soil metagenome]